jgi:hypothetical protein
MLVTSLPVASFSFIIHHLNGETHPNQPWHWRRGNLRLLGQRLGERRERESGERERRVSIDGGESESRRERENDDGGEERAGGSDGGGSGDEDLPKSFSSPSPFISLSPSVSPSLSVSVPVNRYSYSFCF